MSATQPLPPGWTEQMAADWRTECRAYERTEALRRRAFGQREARLGRGCGCPACVRQHLRDPENDPIQF